MKYVVGGRGWSVQVLDGELFLPAGTVVDDTKFPYQLLANRGPPIDALPLDAATYQGMTSTGGVVGLGYPVWRVDGRLVAAIVVPPATHFSVSAPGSVVAGTPFNITVTALDATNTVVPSYTGTVHFTSSDGLAVLPPNSTLTAGVGTFPVTLKTSGGRTVTATDTVTGSINGTTGSIAVAAGAAVVIVVTAPGTASVGTAFSVSVVVRDAFGNIATGYGGTIHFTSTDGAASLPPNSTLSSGVGAFSATLNTSGNQTITATDTVNSSITGTSGTIAASWAPPQVQGTNPTLYADFTSTNHYWAAGVQQASYGAWKTAISASFSRASTATYISGGVVQTAAANVERFPSGQGIRLTGAATNLAIDSAFNIGNWAVGGGVTITFPSVVAPDGSTNGALFTYPVNNPLAYQPITMASGSTYTISMFFKKASLNYAYISATDNASTAHATAVFDVTGASGTAASQTNVLGGTIASTTLVALSNGWYLASMTFTLTAAAGAYYMFGITNAATGNTFGGSGQPSGSTPAGTMNAWGAQVTQTAFPCDYIPTTTATVTQAADAFSIPFNQTTFTLLASCNSQLNSTQYTALAAHTAGYYPIMINDSTHFGSYNSITTTVGPAFAGGLTSLHKSAIAGNNTTFSLTTDGAVPVSGTGAIFVTGLNNIAIGYAYGGAANSYGNINVIGIWNGVVASTAELQALTT